MPALQSSPPFQDLSCSLLDHQHVWSLAPDYHHGHGDDDDCHDYDDVDDDDNDDDDVNYCWPSAHFENCINV